MMSTLTDVLEILDFCVHIDTSQYPKCEMQYDFVRFHFIARPLCPTGFELEMFPEKILALKGSI